MIDYASFTPTAALAGGGILGLGAAVLVLVNGRIAGISGIVGGLFRSTPRDRAWRLAFLAGVLMAPVVYGLFKPLPAIQMEAGFFRLLLAGLLVGVGTRYGAGCTSGHGVCGLSRLSPRSMIATLCFMATGFASVGLMRYWGV